MLQVTKTVLSQIADVLSIFGFVASIAAWWKASEASKAAREARRSVRTGNAAESLSALGVVSTELLSFIEAGDATSARVRCRDLISAIGKARHRYDRFIAIESREALAQLQVISREISVTGIPAENKAKSRMLRFCHAINQSIVGECGRMISDIESAEE